MLQIPNPEHSSLPCPVSWDLLWALVQRGYLGQFWVNKCGPSILKPSKAAQVGAEGEGDSEEGVAGMCDYDQLL